jgi:hypothetical protein
VIFQTIDPTDNFTWFDRYFRWFRKIERALRRKEPGSTRAQRHRRHRRHGRTFATPYAAARVAIDEKYLAAPNVIGVIVGR